MASVSEKIDARYEILGELGRGGMGVVYKANDLKMDRLVAVKVMTAHAPGRDEYQERFLREARSIARMQHPNIVVVHDFGYHSGAPYITMEYVEGVPLDKVIASRVGLVPLTKVDYIVQICHALHYAHQLGIIHRDVKPGNIMVLEGGRQVKLLDFGIARVGLPSRLTRSGLAIGTTSYMSPEQTQGKKDLDARADIFSAGVVLYELLAGKPPWTGESDYEVMSKIIHEPSPPLAGLSNYPAALDRVFELALAKEPGGRYDTAESMAQALSELEGPLKEQALEEALVCFEYGDLLRANDLVSQILRIDTRDREAIELHGRLHQVAQLQEHSEQVRQLRSTAEAAVAQKRYLEALAAVEEAISIDSANTELFHYRESIRNEVKRREDIRKKLELARHAQEMNDLSTAQELVERALETDPTDTMARMMKSALGQERKRQQLQELAEEASRALAVRAFARAKEFIQELESLDPIFPGIPSLKKALAEGEAEEKRRVELEKLIREIRRVLGSGIVPESLSITQQALVRFPGEPRLLRLRAQAEALSVADVRAIQEQIITVRDVVGKGANSEAPAAAESAPDTLEPAQRVQSVATTKNQEVERNRQAHAEKAVLEQVDDAIQARDYKSALRILASAQLDFPASIQIAEGLQRLQQTISKAQVLGESPSTDTLVGPPIIVQSSQAVEPLPAEPPSMFQLPPSPFPLPPPPVIPPLQWPLVPDTAPSKHEMLSSEKTRWAPTISTGILASDAAAGDRGRMSEAGGIGGFTRFFGAGANTDDDPMPGIRLIVTASADPLIIGTSIRVTSVRFQIGRCGDLAIRDPDVSREHAVIEWRDKMFKIADLGSKNGTYVNGRKVGEQGQGLPFGAVIRLGTVTALTFTCDQISELPDLTGQTIANRYGLIKLLRPGLKTALYEASDSHLPQRVAIKILSPSIAEYPGYLEHFNQEAETAVRLQHPHICRVLDFGQTRLSIGGRPFVPVSYFSMELMEGGNLNDQFVADSVIEFSRVVKWVDDTTDALEFAHRQGVIHAGLKPSSIVFDRNGEIYITDFATAHRIGEPVKPIFLGSPEFLAPEQWKEDTVPTPRVDQYSLAVIAYLMLTGSLPFEGQVDPAIRERNLKRGATLAHEEAAQRGRTPVPAQASEALQQALSVDPDDRYRSIREFFQAFKATNVKPVIQLDRTAKIFISYQRDASSGWAVHFASELERRHHISIFLDTQGTDKAVQFSTRLKKAIRDCDVFVCLLSGTTLQSKWVQEEIRLAWQHNKPMIPVFQESYSQPDPSEELEAHLEMLLGYEGVFLLDRRFIYIEHAIDKLASMVKSSFERPKPTKTRRTRKRSKPDMPA